MQPPDSRLAARIAPLRVALAVGLVAGCVLAQQVLLTRLLAAAVFYHFAFFSISLALLGTGCAALLLFLRPGWFDGPPEAVMSRWCVGLALLLVVVPALLVRIDFPSSGLDTTAGLIARLGAAGVLVSLPFFAAGLVIAMAITRYVGSIGRVYAFDLAGAGLGALVVVPLIWIAGVPTLLVGLGAAASLAGVLFGWSHRRSRLLAIGIGVIAVTATGVAALTHAYYRPAHFQAVLGLKPISDHWTPISRVVGYRSPEGGRGFLTYDLDYAPVISYRRGDPSQAGAH